MLASFIQDRDFRLVLYILSFALFIYGLGGLTGPRTAVRGNRIAAVAWPSPSSRRCWRPTSGSGGW